MTGKIFHDWFNQIARHLFSVDVVARIVLPYYPVLTEESARSYSQYQELARRVPNLIPCGRLGCFKNFNMDQAIEAALEVSGSLGK